MATLTRADVESVLIARCGVALVSVGMDGSTQNGSNADLTDSIRFALRMSGAQLAGTVSVTDADLSVVTGFNIERLCDMAEKRVLETCIERYVYVDSQVDRDSVKYDQLRKAWQARVSAIEAALSKPYGPGVGGSFGGSLVAGRPLRNTCQVKGPNGWPWS